MRPTTDFAKSGLFNILSNRYNFRNCNVLDLYAGTGSLTYEFASRGCTKVTAVDKHPGCIRFIRETLLQLEAAPGIQAVNADALKFLKNSRGPYDIIIADAPFAETPAVALVDIVFSQSLLSKKGILIIEHETRNPLTGTPHLQETRKYGNVSFSFFRAVDVQESAE